MNPIERQALRIRCVEEAIAREYEKQEMQTPIHLCLGEELIAATICSALTPRDPMFAYYRSHGWYLAKGGDLKKMMAELYGKKTGCSGGFGGSMHLVDDLVGFHGTSAIVGAQLAHAVGAALAIKIKGETDRIVTCVFGDGATEQGVFMESLMFAALHSLPILFVCMNNGFAVNSEIDLRQSKYSTIGQRAKSFGVSAYNFDVNGGFPNWFYRPVEHPLFIELQYDREAEHVGPKRFRDDLVAPDDIRQEIEEAFQFAKESPAP